MAPIQYELTEAGMAVTEETRQTGQRECVGERIEYAVSFSSCDDELMEGFIHDLCSCKDVVESVRKKGRELGACRATVMHMTHNTVEILPGVLADAYKVDVRKVQIH